ncbi:MAG: hypothetical protein WC775_04410 [Patescibacteria group bacterium]|jgi:hypothetical protein
MKEFVAFFVSLFSGLNLISQPTVVPTPFVPYSISTPPKESARGTITDLSGEVLWQSRSATDGAVITRPQMVKQGEELQTRNGTVDVEFRDMAIVKLSAESHVNFVQTLPASFVVQQRSGNATYVRLGATPLSVRVRGMLVEMSEGTATITVNPDRPIVSVEAVSGEATVGFNNLYVVSQVIKIPEGNILYYNDETRETDLVNSTE